MESDNNSPNLITIRPYRISDADDLLSYLGDDKVTRFTRCKTFTTKEEAVSFINEFCLPHQYCRSICIDDRSIGLLFIRPECGEDKCRAEVGYALAAKYWGQGITVTAMRMAILDGLKMFPDLVRLQATVEIDNKPSQRVLQKLGFLQEGVLRKYTHNKGIVTIALRMAVSSVFRELPGLVRLNALVGVENKASQKVLEKVGFLKEGLLRKYGSCKGEIRDFFIYSFLSTDVVL